MNNAKHDELKFLMGKITPYQRIVFAKLFHSLEGMVGETQCFGIHIDDSGNMHVSIRIEPEPQHENYLPKRMQ